MQPLERLDNVQKARLLHELFPAEIPGLIEYTANLCDSLLEHKERVAANWNNGFITVEYWLHLITAVQERIHHKHHHIERSSKVFSEQLFSDLYAVFMVHSLDLYAMKDRKHPNRKFTLAIDLLFNP